MGIIDYFNILFCFIKSNKNKNLENDLNICFISKCRELTNHNFKNINNFLVENIKFIIQNNEIFKQETFLSGEFSEFIKKLENFLQEKEIKKYLPDTCLNSEVNLN